MSPSVQLIPGVFRRDFQRGVVVANASSETQTVPLAGTFTRLKASGRCPGSEKPCGGPAQLAEITGNDGSKVSSVVLQPYDGVILLSDSTSQAAVCDPKRPCDVQSKARPGADTEE
jgi:hypothetical protein